MPVTPRTIHHLLLSSWHQYISDICLVYDRVRTKDNTWLSLTPKQHTVSWPTTCRIYKHTIWGAITLTNTPSTELKLVRVYKHLRALSRSSALLVANGAVMLWRWLSKVHVWVCRNADVTLLSPVSTAQPHRPTLKDHCHPLYCHLHYLNLSIPSFYLFIYLDLLPSAIISFPPLLLSALSTLFHLSPHRSPLFILFHFPLLSSYPRTAITQVVSHSHFPLHFKRSTVIVLAWFRASFFDPSSKFVCESNKPNKIRRIFLIALVFGFDVKMKRTNIL